VHAALDLLAAQPLELLFVVLAVGYAVGRLSLGGVQLGIAAVLFAGLAAGMLDARLQLPEFVRGFGLVVYVYAIGVSSGPAFMASFRRQGLRDSAWTIGLLGLGALVAHVIGRLLGIAPNLIAGLYCGALTNTAALAALLERSSTVGHDAVIGTRSPIPPVPSGSCSRSRWRVAPGGATSLAMRTAPGSTSSSCASPAPMRRTPRSRRSSPSGASGRASCAGVVTITGNSSHPTTCSWWARWSPPWACPPRSPNSPAVWERSDDREDVAHSSLDMRRIFVSDARVAGRSLAELRTLSRFGALVSRVRRGDADMVPDGRTVLELGDRVRVVAPRERMAEVTRFFGDSYRALGEIDAVSFGLGAALGMLLGLLPIPLPGGATFKLGTAGGPLLVGLVLGALGRTGPLVWQVPYSASLTLRQIGLALFLAAVGVNAGAPLLGHCSRAGGSGYSRSVPVSRSRSRRSHCGRVATGSRHRLGIAMGSQQHELNEGTPKVPSTQG
jgi:putative transport protein